MFPFRLFLIIFLTRVSLIQAQQSGQQTSTSLLQSNERSTNFYASNDDREQNDDDVEIDDVEQEDDDVEQEDDDVQQEDDDLEEQDDDDIEIKTYEEFNMFYGNKKYFYSYQQQYRQQVFYQNLKKIQDFNREQFREYSLAVNQFADIDQKEFRSQFASLQPQKAIYDIRDTRLLQEQHQNINVNTIDWSCHSGSVDNQGICGSCYAFVAADSVSTLYAIHEKNRNLRLSVQQLVSCSDAVLENGCQGGLFQNAFDYIMKKGLTSAFNYPYTSAFTRKPPGCNIKKIKSGKKWKIKSYRNIQRNCQSIKYELQAGPIAVGINSQNLQFYRKGSFKGSINGFTDHAVLLIGYDEQKGFKIKNIWGRTWGILGYGWIHQIQHAGLCSRAISIDIPGQKKGVEQCVQQQVLKSNNITFLNVTLLNETDLGQTSEDQLLQKLTNFSSENLGHQKPDKLGI